MALLPRQLAFYRQVPIDELPATPSKGNYSFDGASLKPARETGKAPPGSPPPLAPCVVPSFHRGPSLQAREAQRGGGLAAGVARGTVDWIGMQW